MTQKEKEMAIKLYELKCQAYGMENNCYFLHNTKTQDCIVIDPAGDGQQIVNTLEQLMLTPRLILLTHGHFDHIMGVAALKTCYDVPVAIHADDAAMLTDSNLNFGRTALGIDLVMPAADRLISDGETIEEAGVNIKVIHTPGHSPGSCCFVCEGSMFTGDTIFWSGAGRTDTPGGNLHNLINSIAVIFALPGDYTIYPGHMRPTTLGFERKNNTFVKHYAPAILHK